MRSDIICPGCKLKLKNENLLTSERFNASGECFKLFTNLCGFTLSNNDEQFIHQLIVDAYGAQHAGGCTKNITVIFALIGLCLVVEYNYTGRQVQLVHMKVPKQKWPPLELPYKKALITVKDVLEAPTYLQKEILIYKWVRSVLDSWAEQHNYICKITNSLI